MFSNAGVKPSEVEEAMQLMKKYNVSRLIMGSVSIEMRQSVMVIPETEPAPHGMEPVFDPADVCACGHSIEVEHSAAGCLVGGCSAKMCAQEKGAPPSFPRVDVTQEQKSIQDRIRYGFERTPT